MGKLCNTVLGMLLNLTGYLLTTIKACTSYMYYTQGNIVSKPTQEKNILPLVKQSRNKAKSHKPDHFSAVWYNTTSSTTC